MEWLLRRTSSSGSRGEDDASSGDGSKQERAVPEEQANAPSGGRTTPSATRTSGGSLETPPKATRAGVNEPKQSTERAHALLRTLVSPVKGTKAEMDTPVPQGFDIDDIDKNIAKRRSPQSNTSQRHEGTASQRQGGATSQRQGSTAPQRYGGTAKRRSLQEMMSALDDDLALIQKRVMNDRKYTIEKLQADITEARQQLSLVKQATRQRLERFASRESDSFKFAKRAERQREESERKSKRETLQQEQTIRRLKDQLDEITTSRARSTFIMDEMKLELPPVVNIVGKINATIPLVRKWALVVRERGRTLGKIHESTANTLPIVLLPTVFFFCVDMVESFYQGHVRYFLGGDTRASGDRLSSTLEPSTEKAMVLHLRRHFQSLFPLSGDALEDAYRELLRTIPDHEVWRETFGLEPRILADIMDDCSFKPVVEAYLSIMVSCILQRPRGVFTDDCGRTKVYDRQMHLDLDGESNTTASNRCVVVWPALEWSGRPRKELPTKRCVIRLPKGVG